jgi:hypothetical protein
VLTAAEMQAKAEAEGCLTLPNRDAVQLVDPFNIALPNFLPKQGSPALSGFDYAGMDSWFTQSNFRGAFGTTNWMEGWTNFNPKVSNY